LRNGDWVVPRKGGDESGSEEWPAAERRGNIDRRTVLRQTRGGTREIARY
jgi:hypothetical protein